MNDCSIYVNVHKAMGWCAASIANKNEMNDDFKDDKMNEIKRTKQKSIMQNIYVN